MKLVNLSSLVTSSGIFSLNPNLIEEDLITIIYSFVIATLFRCNNNIYYGRIKKFPFLHGRQVG